MLGKDNDTGREFAIKMLEKKHLMKEKKVKYATTERDIQQHHIRFAYTVRYSYQVQPPQYCKVVLYF